MTNQSTDGFPGLPRPAGIDHGARLEAFRGALDELGVDVAIVTSPLSVFHLSGIWTGSFMASPALLVSASDHVVVIRRLDLAWRDAWAGRSWVRNWLDYRDDEHLDEVIGRAASTLLLRPDGAIGFEGPASLRLLDAAGTSNQTDLTETLLTLRAVKEPAELAMMAEAVAITINGFEAACDALGGGATDALASAAAYQAMIASGSEVLAYHPIVVGGRANRAVHMPWAGVRPSAGEPVTMMMGGIVGGYAAPLERTFFMGKVPERIRPLLASVAEAIEAVLADAVPGMTGADVDRIAREVHRRNGFGDQFLHRTGYSCGINWADLALMQLHPGETRQIERGMTFHLVPHLYDPELGLIAISQPVVVRDKGCEPLLRFPLLVEPIEMRS